MSPADKMLDLAKRSKEASQLLRLASTEQKNEALLHIAKALEERRHFILEANKKDLKLGKELQLSEAMLDRLSLESRFESVVFDVRKVAELPDPVGEIIETSLLPNQLQLKKIRTPIGVILVIYESRPNVTVDVTSLSLKTNNCIILRGGKETLHSNRALVEVIHGALAKTKLPEASVQLINSRSRTPLKQLLKLDQFIDMVIPRGGAPLQNFCLKESTIPVITGGIGICHLFVDRSVDIDRAIKVVVNAKTQRPSVCNALDTLLVHTQVASQFLPKVLSELRAHGVTFRLDSPLWDMLKPEERQNCQRATEGDWQTEWLSLVLGIKMVSSLQDAIDHIQKYGSGHSDGILTNSKADGEAFVAAIDSAAVYINASTRFTDGAQFGLGAEVAVSTQKLHARGPMGLKELTSSKWVAIGDYHVR